MPVVPLRLDRTVDLASGFDAIRQELGIPEAFPPDVLAEAEAAADGPSIAATTDLRDVPFLTIDPPGSMDLDQAMALSRRSGGGSTLRYAIADVAAVVRPGGAIDAEARRRAVTVYLPDRRSPLHPPVLGEGAASLLPGVDRQALVWTIELDAEAAPVDVRVERALVRSRRRFTYAEVQDLLDGGRAEEPLELLREVGRAREAAEVARGGVSLRIPEQRVVEVDGRYELRYRAPLATEGWNAQLSLLTGMSAARLMMEGGVGILRTLPPPAPQTVDELRRRAIALGVRWPPGQGDAYPEVIRGLDPNVPTHAALLAAAARLFRGAGYLAFRDGPPPGTDPVHAAVAAHYAHVTAPLRRLVDRFGNEIVLALCAGQEPPTWATDALDELPDLMQAGRRREAAANGMALDLVEAAVLACCEGTLLDAVVISVGRERATVQVRDPAIATSVPSGRLRAGQEVRVRVVGADVPRRRLDLEAVAGYQS